MAAMYDLRKHEPMNEQRLPTAAPAWRRLLYPVIIVLAGLAIRLPLLDAPGFLHDQEQFIIWGYVAREHGLARVYDAVETTGGTKRLSNYPPVQIYVCRLLAEAYPLITGRPIDLELLQEINARAVTPSALAAYALFKWPAVIADLATALLLYYSIRRRQSITFAVSIGLVYVLLPNIWHNSAVWGAVDSLPALFVLASLESSVRRRLHWMWPLAILAMLTKPQACIFLPIWICLSLRPQMPTARDVLIGAGAVLCLLVALLFPFRNALAGVWETYVGASGFYPFTHLNGFSVWFLGRPLASSQLDGNLLEHYLRDDAVQLLGLTARQLGYLGMLLVTGYVIAIIWRLRRSIPAIHWAIRILPLAFFVLSTQMHERYLYSAVAAWAWTASPAPRWWIAWLLLAGCAAINVFWVWVGPFGSAVAASLQNMLHQKWLGLVPGVWCSMALVGLLLFALRPPALRAKALQAAV